MCGEKNGGRRNQTDDVNAAPETARGVRQGKELQLQRSFHDRSPARPDCADLVHDGEGPDGSL